MQVGRDVGSRVEVLELDEQAPVVGTDLVGAVQLLRVGSGHRTNRLVYVSR